MAEQFEMTKEQWLQRRSEDPFWRKAKEFGYPSRAAFKLLEIQKRWRVIRERDKVLDLGAAPGGMTAVESDIVGDKGLVVAVDVEELKLQRPNVIFVKADVFETRFVRELENILQSEFFDTVISDLSPHHSGDYDLLVEQQLELLDAVLDICRRFLRPGGTVVLKAFEHPSLRVFEQRMVRSFRKIERYVPRASKKGSSEIFLLGFGYRGMRRLQHVEPTRA
ncbi:MAG: RlmE family RNA methyltransferase [Candidatus Caldarchaeum sp.]